MDIPTELDIGSYCLDSSDVKFLLKAVCFHHGEEIEIGHYTSLYSVKQKKF